MEKTDFNKKPKILITLNEVKLYDFNKIYKHLKIKHVTKN